MTTAVRRGAITLAIALVMTSSAACRFDTPPTPSPTSTPTPPIDTSTAAPTPTAAPIEVPGYLLDPNVTQETINSTVCVVGWTARVRPPSSYTTPLKRRQLAAANAADQTPSHYEEDHWIPLELGGAPRDERNLWPEPIADARVKDAAENTLHARVCDGTLGLRSARLIMWANWSPTRITLPTRVSPPTPPETTGGGDVYYVNCDAVRVAGRAPLYRGQPGYRLALDRDKDGIACE